MKDTHQFRVAGVGTAIGAVLFGALLATSCAPGKLPCDKDEQWRAVCEEEPTTGQGGSGGGGGGMGGGSGMGGSSGMGGAGGPLSAATAVANCTDYPTLGKMDDFFGARCGGDATCHTGAGALAWKDLKMPDVWSRMQTAPATVFVCASAKMIDKTDWAKSALWLATQTPLATCPSGMITRAMPPQNVTAGKQDPLTAAELTCLENYLKAIAAAP